MRFSTHLPLLFITLALSACASLPPRTYDLNLNREAKIPEMAKDIADADVIFLGEVHHNPYVHEFQLDTIREIHQLRPDMAISMEMVERDQQEALDRYLSWRISEAEFLAALKTDRRSAGFFKYYKPIFQYAATHKIPVIAANVPRPLAARVAKDGLEANAKAKFMPRRTSAPKDSYWEAFKAAFNEGGHGAGMSDDVLYRYYVAQCVKDDAMAESIVDYLEAQKQKNRSPVVMHLCGSFHSDYGRGTVARVRERMPDAHLEIVSSKATKGAKRPSGQMGIAHYLWVVPKVERKPVTMPKPAGAKTAKAEPHTKSPHGAAGEVFDPEARPGLNFMPNYEGSEDPGLLIDQVTEGGVADKAGLKPGDLIIKIGDDKVEDIHSYMDALGNHRPGDTITVTVKRDGKVKEFKVRVGMRGNQPPSA